MISLKIVFLIKIDITLSPKQVQILFLLLFVLQQLFIIQLTGHSLTLLIELMLPRQDLLGSLLGRLGLLVDPRGGARQGSFQPTRFAIRLLLSRYLL